MRVIRPVSAPWNLTHWAVSSLITAPLRGFGRRGLLLGTVLIGWAAMATMGITGRCDGFRFLCLRHVPQRPTVSAN